MKPRWSNVALVVAMLVVPQHDGVWAILLARRCRSCDDRNDFWVFAVRRESIASPRLATEASSYSLCLTLALVFCTLDDSEKTQRRFDERLVFDGRQEISASKRIRREVSRLKSLPKSSLCGNI